MLENSSEHLIWVLQLTQISSFHVSPHLPSLIIRHYTCIWRNDVTSPCNELSSLTPCPELQIRPPLAPNSSRVYFSLKYQQLRRSTEHPTHYATNRKVAVRFPMESLEFFSYIILLVALWSWVRISF
jgi:hypothetical protein